MRQPTARKVPMSFRTTPATRNAIKTMAKAMKTTNSMQIEQALKKYIENPPTELPLEIQIELSRAKMQEKINTIKDLLWTYHKTRDATTRIENMQLQNVPPHAQSALKKMEQDIIDAQKQLDDLIRQGYKGGD
jgi:hypothetical protein